MNCTNLAVNKNMTALTLTIDTGSEVRSHDFPCKGQFKAGDFKPQFIENVLRLLVGYYYPDSVEQVDEIKLFRSQLVELTALMNKYPHLAINYRERMPEIYQDAQRITEEGTEAFKLYRSALRKMNSFASGVESDEDPEKAQARREAYLEKKRETGTKNVQKAIAKHKENAVRAK